MMPKVSVITPVYNGEKFIQETIESVLNQTYTDYEYLIVDDGSTDNTRRIIEGYVKRFPVKVHYIYQSNGGPAKARNAALKVAQGEYIAFLDADDLWMPHRLEEGVKVLDEHKEIALVHGRTIRMDENGKRLPSPERDARILNGEMYEHLLSRRAHISCLTVLLRKICLNDIGLFDENSKAIGVEDRDLWIRLAKKFPFYFLDQEVGYYRVLQNSLSRDPEKGLVKKIYVIEKNCENNVIKRQALGTAYKETADEMLSLGQIPSARKYYYQALTQQPFYIFYWSGWLKTFFRKSAAVFLAVFVLVSIIFSVPTFAAAKEIIVIFRYDDYGNGSPLDLDLKLIETFKRIGKTISFGVIPYQCPENDRSMTKDVPLTEERITVLKNAVASGTVEAVLHGYCHTVNEKDPSGGDSEFRAYAYDEQVVRLKKGREHLENVLDVPVPSFIPPYNSYNEDTIKALEATDFKILSADRNRSVIKNSKLIYLPKSCMLHELQSAIEWARKIPEKQSIVHVLFHPFDLRPLNEKLKMKMDYRKFEQLVDWVAAQPDVKIMSIGQAAEHVKDLSAERYSIFKAFYKFSKLYPPEGFLNTPISRHVYSEPETVKNAAGKFILFFGGLFLSSALASWAVFRFVFKFKTKEMVLIRMMAGLAVLIVYFYASWNSELYFKGLLMMIISAGFFIGTCLPVKREKAL